MELFLPLSGLWLQNFFFTQCFWFLPRSSKLIFKTGTGIIKTGNGIISSTSRPLIKKLLLQSVFNFHQVVQNWFSKQKKELSKQEMELFLPFPCLWSKNFLYKMLYIFPKEFKIDFQNRRKESFKQEMELFLLWSKKSVPFFIKEFKIYFQSRIWNYPNR